LGFAERAFALITFGKPLHDAVAVELLLAGLTGLFRQLATAVHYIIANCALLHARKLLIDILFP
jgi:hypothetical protein